MSILRALTTKLAPAGLAAAVERAAEDWPIDPRLKELLDGMTEESSKHWANENADAIRSRMEADLFGRPFLDVGRKRIVSWRALGIRWSVSFDNEHGAVAVCEEFLATLQIVVADLATTHLALLPTSVHIEISVTPGPKVVRSEDPSNEEAKWRVELPRRLIGEQRSARELVPEAIGLVSVLLGKCSTLSMEAFQAKLKVAVEAGLFEKTMVVRPYSQLYSEIVGSDDFDADVRARHDPFFVGDVFLPQQATELAWKDGDGPSYSVELAHQYIENRYARTLAPIRFSLPRLLADPTVGPRLRALRELGKLCTGSTG